ncbi:YdiU family protein [Octadecabacter sp. 1_MG-2023]|uniref:protein adenylyltransferase SelO n=1 Tax=unclassified Octadecabacter TaxID=196158 RepID=UPI001C082058|nr:MULTISPECIES: YdiU family protein [unclassified Octadecabacter]MBU2993670.1 YdiU family protein [Octadecabacter sp. B2R22]MDO6735486.1 YdiU family protein [Octadecabacter sp. 1_MG-2023]
MSLTLPFETTYLTLPDRFYSKHAATPVSAPSLIVFNHDLAAELGIDTSDMSDEDAAYIFSGNEVLAGSTPFAQVYAGHQFGGFSPQLGDGRALHLGEIDSPLGRVDIQLKGSGPTPYSRNGDGRAWVGPVLREYLMSCAMQALDIPTTKALAAVLTGDPVLREQGPLPGAVLTRVASSHIRVGTFQYFAARSDVDGLRELMTYTIERHYPSASGPTDLIKQVMQRQIQLVAKWMSVGFIHGVMNTDNVSVAGETIDFGPCAFMDTYHPDTVFSSIDRRGRYAYSNQGPLTHWNLAQFATSLVALMPDTDLAIEEFTALLNTFPDLFEAEWARVFAPKLGLSQSDETTALIKELLSLMSEANADFTNTFNALNQTEQTFPEWYAKWRAAGPNDDLWRETNPQVIPRTHKIEQAITAATTGDFAPFHTMLAAVKSPFTPSPDFATPPEEDEKVRQTFCGT